MRGVRTACELLDISLRGAHVKVEVNVGDERLLHRELAALVSAQRG